MIHSMHQLQAATTEAWHSLVETVSGLRDDDWNRPTPCTGWSVKDVLAHLGHIEGLLVHGFEQPDPPDWIPEGSPLDQVTGHGVASRRAWSAEQVADEVKRAAEATLNLMDDPILDWDEETPTPIGPAPRRIGAEMRVTDVVIHLCDIRTAIGAPLDQGYEPKALAAAVGRAFRLTPWAWAKKVRAQDGDRLRLRLRGIESIETDVVMDKGRAMTVPVGDDAPSAEVEGNSLAYLLAASGRHGQAASAGGLVARGELARLLLEKYRLVG
jgi:uncharacterized protein (TIGR03083 family)